MPRRAAGLAAAKVAKASPGRYGDGAGLYLLVRSTEAKFWLFRYTRNGKMREMGLGPAAGRTAVSLAKARERAAELHDAVRAGRDPLEDREAEEIRRKAEAAKAAAEAITFKACTEKYVIVHSAGWRSAKHAAQWMITVTSYAYPVIGDLPVASVETGHVTQILGPIWSTKTQTASRLRARIEAVLDYAKTNGWRTGENPARWKGHLENVLPKPNKVAKVEHYAALPWQQIGGFMGELAKQGRMGALALRFAILTAARTNEVIGARWVEIDLANALWTVPKERMKGGREHRVPLSNAAQAVLRELLPLRDAAHDDWVFPGGRADKSLSNMAMWMTLRALGRPDLTVHGFRSTFRDWCAETGKPADIAEASLAHTLGSKTQAAYQRGDLLERRRKLMNAWAEFCSHPMPAEGGNVVELRATEAA